MTSTRFLVINDSRGIPFRLRRLHGKRDYETPRRRGGGGENTTKRLREDASRLSRSRLRLSSKKIIHFSTLRRGDKKGAFFAPIKDSVTGKGRRREERGRHKRIYSGSA